jgi:hypothetical protein
MRWWCGGGSTRQNKMAKSWDAHPIILPNIMVIIQSVKGELAVAKD